MSNPTSNFNWQMPTSSDLVTSLPADFEVFGQAVDTSLADLKGGTTGQILSKASNTDMDFTWVAPTTGDITGVSVTSPITGGGTSGDVTIGISSSAVVPSQTGNSGKYLTTDGTTSSWGTISAGSYTQLATGSLSGASVSLTSISQSYNKLVLVMHNVSISANDQIGFRVNGYTSADYGTAVVENNSGTLGGVGYSLAKLTYTNMDNTSAGASFVINFDNYAQTTGYLTGTFVGSYIATSSVAKVVNGGFGYYGGTAAILSIQMIANYGGAYTFDSGTYTLYGVK